MLAFLYLYTKPVKHLNLFKILVRMLYLSGISVRKFYEIIHRQSLTISKPSSHEQHIEFNRMSDAGIHLTIYIAIIHCAEKVDRYEVDYDLFKEYVQCHMRGTPTVISPPCIKPLPVAGKSFLTLSKQKLLGLYEHIIPVIIQQFQILKQKHSLLLK